MEDPQFLTELASKLNDPHDVFIYLIIVGLFCMLIIKDKIIKKMSDQLGRTNELLRFLVYGEKDDED